MILATKRWTNFLEELEVIIRSKIACNGRRVKTSGIVLMAIIKRIANYHIETCHNTSYLKIGRQGWLELTIVNLKII
jgi:hypothetical protein